jgi:hypothetical protein
LKGCEGKKFVRGKREREKIFLSTRVEGMPKRLKNPREQWVSTWTKPLGSSEGYSFGDGSKPL